MVTPSQAPGDILLDQTRVVCLYTRPSRSEWYRTTSRPWWWGGQSKRDGRTPLPQTRWHPCL